MLILSPNLNIHIISYMAYGLRLFSVSLHKTDSAGISYEISISKTRKESTKLKSCSSSAVFETNGFFIVFLG